MSDPLTSSKEERERILQAIAARPLDDQLLLAQVIVERAIAQLSTQ